MADFDKGIEMTNTTPGGPQPFRVDHEGPEGSPRLVLVHGLGGSHVNWSALAPLLARTTRPVALDLAGFGFTLGGRREANVNANAALLTRFLRDEIREPVFLVGNSMGGMISVIVAAAHPELVRGVVLIDPVLPKPRGVTLNPQVRNAFGALLIPVLGPRTMAKRQAAVSIRRRVELTLALCVADFSRLTTEQLEAEVALVEAREDAADRITAHVAATRSLVRRVYGGSYKRELAAITRPVLLLHGVHDVIVPVASADAAAARFPHWTYHRMDAGHTPQMELPALTTDHITTWIEELA